MGVRGQVRRGTSMPKIDLAVFNMCFFFPRSGLATLNQGVRTYQLRVDDTCGEASQREERERERSEEERALQRGELEKREKCIMDIEPTSRKSWPYGLNPRVSGRRRKTQSYPPLGHRGGHPLFFFWKLPPLLREKEHRGKNVCVK